MEKLFNFVSLPCDAIEVKVIKRPKQKPLKKLKLMVLLIIYLKMMKIIILSYIKVSLRIKQKAK